jgi:uncharacterized protein (DUF2147 family)
MLVVLSALVLALQATASGVSPGVVGLWKTAGDEGLVRIEACGQAICGRVAADLRAGDPPPQTKVGNRRDAARDRAIDGQLIMKLKALGPGRWGDGWIHNPDDGKTYKASIALTPDGRLRLKGCLVVPLCRTQTWTRVGVVAGRGATATAQGS